MTVEADATVEPDGPQAIGQRRVLIIIGALFDRMAPVLWVIAVLSNITVIHRMIYTYQECKRLEDAQLRSVRSATPINS